MKIFLTSLFLLYTLNCFSQKTFSATYDVYTHINIPEANGSNYSKTDYFAGFMKKVGNSFVVIRLPLSEKNTVSDTIRDQKNSMVNDMSTQSDRKMISFASLDSNYYKSVMPFSSGVNVYCGYFMPGKTKWEILPDTKIINGLKCQKAIKYTSNKAVSAEIWFYSAINLGGIDINSLRDTPGLVVEATFLSDNTKTVWSMKEYKINPSLAERDVWLPELNEPCRNRETSKTLY